MKTSEKYFLLAITFTAFIAMIVLFRKRDVLPGILPGNKSVSAGTEWLQSRQAMEGLLQTLQTNPKDDKARLSLALLYIQESRVTGNHAYYDKASLQLIDQLLEHDAKNYDAICAKGTVLLSQHHFRDALNEGKCAAAIQPYSASAYGILTDANVELGDYESAIVAAEQMNGIRPDLRSYARISYLREIFGDMEGAKEAMHMAVQCGVPGTEQTEWVRTCLGRLYENSGQLDAAGNLYRQVLVHRPGYAYAYAGLARIAWATGKRSEAEKLFINARAAGQPDAFAAELSSFYRGTNDVQSVETAREAIASLSGGSNKEGTTGHGHYADRELALLYLQVYRYDLALAHAQVEYNRRPFNIDANRTLAWVYFRRGEYKEANRYIQVALRTGSKNPGLLLESALIEARAGHVARGRKLAQQALGIQPCCDVLLRSDLARAFGTVSTNLAMN